MADMYYLMLENLQSFSQKGCLFVLTLVSVLFLIFKKNRTKGELVLALIGVFTIFVYFCPIWFLYTSMRTDAEILYRILWIMPSLVIVCYTLVTVVFYIDKKYRAVSVLAASFIIILCGDYIYDNPWFNHAENAYHIPQSVIDICDYMEVPGREIKGCFPDELIPFVRQYTPFICLAYGRDSLLTGRNEKYSELEYNCNQSVINVEVVSELLRQEFCPYFVIDEDKKLNGDFSDFDFTLVTNIDGYDIYLDDNAYIGLGLEWYEDD